MNVCELASRLNERWSWADADVLSDWCAEQGFATLASALQDGPKQHTRSFLNNLLVMYGVYRDMRHNLWWHGWTYDAHVYARGVYATIVPNKVRSVDITDFNLPAGPEDFGGSDYFGV